MSYQSHLVVVDCDARMKAIDVGRARRMLEKADLFIDSCFLDEMRKATEGALDEGLATAAIEIPKDRCWFSGNHLNVDSLAIIASMIQGKLSGYFVGEDGSLYGGFVVADGQLVKCDVNVTLTPKEAG